MIDLRNMNAADIEIFKKWLYLPYVSKWYHDPLDWIDEVKKQDDEFSWIHHFIVEYDGKPVGFCQYYSCDDSDEPWGDYKKLGGSYSIDYLIGDEAYLRKGFGKQIVEALIVKIKNHKDACRIVVEPEKENTASCRLLLSCGFTLCSDNGIFVKELT